MKNSKILVAALAFTVLAWLAAPLLALYPKWVHSIFSPECIKSESAKTQLSAVNGGPTATPTTCDNLISQLGQSGDIFGAATSLFSGLALFAVAFALYADLAYRRKEKKPLVVCNIDDNILTFDKPTDGDPKSFYFVGKMSVYSISETAINAKVAPSLIIDSKKFSLETLNIQVPLEAGKSQSILISDMLTKAAIDKLCANQQFLPPMQLEIMTTCSNLDGEKFSSEVKYNIALHFLDNLNRIMSIRHSGQALDGAWNDRSSIPLVCTLVAGSWKFNSLN